MTPPTKEAYYYRMVFEQHFPSMASVCTVPQVKSIACSTEKAMEWDESFRKNTDESGRAVLGIHVTSGTNNEIILKSTESSDSKKLNVKVTLDTRFSPGKLFK